MADSASLDTLVQEFQAKAAAMGLNPPAGIFSLASNQAPPPSSNPNSDTSAGANQNLGAGNFAGSSFSAPTTPQRPGFRSKNEFERVTGDIPIEKFEYGKEEADWQDWSLRFERAVQAATNAYGRDRLEELCLMWIPLKLAAGAQPIYNKCEHRDKNWPLLRAELAEALEDPRIKRRWARHPDAYKKPANVTLQVYRANIIGYVNKYSPAVVADKEAYSMELYNRFVNGLEVDWREYLEDTIPFGKETLDNAYNQALKYESKLAKKSVDFTVAAMSDAEKDNFEKMRLDMEQMKTQISSMAKKPDSWRSRSPKKKKEDGGKESSEKRSYKDSPYRGSKDRRSSSGQSGRSSAGRSRSGSGNRFRAIDTADEDSDAEATSRFKQQMAEAMAECMAKSMKGLSVRSKNSKGSKSSKSSKRSPRSKKD